MLRRIVVALLMVGLGVSGCGDSAPAADSADAGTVLTVFVGDEVVAEWTLEALEAELDFVTFEMDGDEQTGPRLLDVMAASGVGQWTVAEVLGKGEGRAFEVGVEISAATVDDTWLFDVTNRGTLKLAAVDLPRERWVRDAGEIRIP